MQWHKNYNKTDVLKRGWLLAQSTDTIFGGHMKYFNVWKSSFTGSEVTNGWVFDIWTNAHKSKRMTKCSISSRFMVEIKVKMKDGLGWN